MEEDSKSEEPFLKIETVWSETEGNFGNITVKEEVISDVEPESFLEESNGNYLTPSTNDGTNHYQNETEPKSHLEEAREVRNEEIIDKRKKDLSKGSTTDSARPCLHDAKNFKVVKKRLRCNDCDAIICPECCSSISSSLQTHFSKFDNNSKSLYPCKLCSMIFKSNCALQAHIRIHLLDTPYVCPDCGAVYNNIYFLSLHLINKCYHVYKVITNGCKFCLSQNMAPENYISHIQQTHIKPVYKCSQCGLMFENITDINRHLGTSHKSDNAMCLSYFCCSMCGNLLISKQLYAKHIKYHQDHSASFQIGYLCSCGYSFNTACSFRNHFKGCKKKGILPPQWTYLQVTLKTHEMLQVQSAVQKSTFLQSDKESKKNQLACDDESRGEPKKLNYSLFEDGDSSDEIEEHSEETSNSNDSEMSRERENRNGDVIVAPNGGTCESENQKENENLNETQKNGDGNVGENEVKNSKEPASSNNSEAGKKTSTVPLVGEPSQEPMDMGNQESQSGKDSEIPDREGDKALRDLYDHIPCDHLGYLKTQKSSDLTDKNVTNDIGDGVKKCEFVDLTSPINSDNFVITSVLDEKTGLMRTKKIFVQKSTLEDDEDLEMSEFPNIQCREFQKPRSSTFFSCPFCSVLFPKHYSSFQRFRLHLECYHPEAALDITVDRTQVPKSQTPFTSIKISENDLDSDEDLFDLDDIDLQTRLDKSMKDSSREELTKSLTTSESSNDGSLQNEICEKKKQRFEMKLRSGKNVEGKLDNRKNSITRMSDNVEEALNHCTASEKRNEDDNGQKNISNIDDLDSESMESDICGNFNRVVKSKNNVEGNGRKEGKGRGVSEDSFSDEKGETEFRSEVQNSGDDKGRQRVKSSRATHREHAKGEDMDGERSEFVKEEIRPSERRNSRRESDVWSEFYKTLKIAETLKKTKVKEGNEEASIISNYANKRVVKKPKRYRESSDSEDSNEETSRADPDDGDSYIKKKRLLNRLENVDYRILDYVFKILKRKQKGYAMSKKESGMRGFKRKLVRLGKLPKTGENNDGDGDYVEKDQFDCSLEEGDWDMLEEKSDKRRGRPRKIEGMVMKDRRRSDFDKEVSFMEKNIEGEESDFFANKRKRKLSSRLLYCKKTAEKTDFSSGQVISTVKPSETEKNLTCAICKEIHQTEVEFREHIQNHRMDENNYQCMECGECFVVRPSLEKHLHAFHKIKDVQKYIEENECSTPEKLEEVDNEPLKENQCKVCRDEFPTIHDLNKHFRVHGMAFIRQFKKDPKSN